MATSGIFREISVIPFIRDSDGVDYSLLVFSMAGFFVFSIEDLNNLYSNSIPFSIQTNGTLTGLTWMGYEEFTNINTSFIHDSNC